MRFGLDRTTYLKSYAIVPLHALVGQNHRQCIPLADHQISYGELWASEHETNPSLWNSTMVLQAPEKDHQGCQEEGSEIQEDGSKVHRQAGTSKSVWKHSAAQKVAGISYWVWACHPISSHGLEGEAWQLEGLLRNSLSTSGWIERGAGAESHQGSYGGQVTECVVMWVCLKMRLPSWDPKCHFKGKNNDFIS
ncbi:unnamed protein product [Cladocopium goreaui]|uniref:Uncharacterized protein n=1 Tax=Cladocopium goreaui TaxID=2562237 RepID=A0A9P1BTB2_9DINO|nr:unnamed protein product [Cladocopium goreaui]